MSYDIGLEIDTGGPEPAGLGHGWNYTSNCAPMWREAGANLAEYDGKTAAECTPSLADAIALMRKEPARFKALDPENGWGSYDSLLPFLDELLRWLQANPKATVRVSH